MGTQITSIAVLAASGGREASEEERQTVAKLFKEADGFLVGYAGVDANNSTTGVFVSEWENSEKFEAFRKAHADNSLFENLQDVATSKHNVTVHLSPPYPHEAHQKAFTSPTSTVIWTSPKQGVDIAQFEAALAEGRKMLEKGVPGLNSYIDGKTIGNSNEYVIVEGWESIEAEQKVADANKDNILAQLMDLNIMHVVFQTF